MIARSDVNYLQDFTLEQDIAISVTYQGLYIGFLVADLIWKLIVTQMFPKIIF